VPRREPWSHGPQYERANRATIRLRYQLLPVLYTAFHQHARDGAPVVRPLFWSHLADTTALGVNDEFLLGDHLLAAPVVDSAANTRAVYLPEGRWYRLGSDSVYDGGRRVTVPAPTPLRDDGDTTGLRGLPLFARAGAVIPIQAVVTYEGARAVDTLTLHVWPAVGAPVTSEVYEDAGDGYAYERGEYRLTTCTTSSGGMAGGVEVACTRTGKYPGARAFAIEVHAISRPRSVRVDGRAVPVRYDAVKRTAAFVAPGGVRRIVVTP
jgi:alpha-glucosidase